MTSLLHQQPSITQHRYIEMASKSFSRSLRALRIPIGASKDPLIVRSIPLMLQSRVSLTLIIAMFSTSTLSNDGYRVSIEQ
jgi:hypothetical protein